MGGAGFGGQSAQLGGECRHGKRRRWAELLDRTWGSWDVRDDESGVCEVASVMTRFCLFLHRKSRTLWDVDIDSKL